VTPVTVKPIRAERRSGWASETAAVSSMTVCAANGRVQQAQGAGLPHRQVRGRRGHAEGHAGDAHRQPDRERVPHHRPIGTPGGNLIGTITSTLIGTFVRRT
jgi:hypothetical protein